jgi:hypothetical protein
MHEFLRNNRDELIARCKYKVSKRPRRAATQEQLANGVPLFLDQLTRTLEAEEANEAGESMRISGASGGDSLALSEMGVAAAAHGSHLLKLGFSVDQVVQGLSEFLCVRRLKTCPRRRSSLATNERRGGQVGAAWFMRPFS